MFISDLMKRLILSFTFVALSVLIYAVPSNNTCKDAFLLTYTGSCNFQTYSNDSATQSNDASPSCASNYSSDKWYKVVVPANGVLVIDTRYVDVLKQDELVLKDSPPFVGVMGLGDSSVDLAVRPHCNSEHYWDVWFNTFENVKKALDANNIEIPYPQRDVHMRD